MERHPKALKAKIDELSSAKDQLSISLNKTIDQKQQLINNISTLKDKRQTMVTALAKMSTEKESLVSALNKTKELKTAVPNAFEQSKREYLSSIDASSGKIQQVFQSVLNVGFKQMFLTVFLANLLGLVVLLFYRYSKEGLRGYSVPSFCVLTAAVGQATKPSAIDKPSHNTIVILHQAH